MSYGSASSILSSRRKAAEPGLGLPIVKRLINTLNGSIRLRARGTAAARSQRSCCRCHARKTYDASRCLSALWHATMKIRSTCHDCRSTENRADPRRSRRHYIRDLIYGANDGIITTFAVVAGVTGGALSSRAVRDYRRGEPCSPTACRWALATISASGRTRVPARRRGWRKKRPALEGTVSRRFWRSSFAGAIPLLPYAFPHVDSRAALSVVLTFTALFAVGSLRSLVTIDRWCCGWCLRCSAWERW